MEKRIIHDMWGSSCWRKFLLEDAASTEGSGRDRIKKLSTQGGGILSARIRCCWSR